MRVVRRDYSMFATLSHQFNKLAKFATRPVSTRWLLIPAVMVLGTLAWFVFMAPPAALTTATTRQPERFTELYFSNHLTLPREVTTNQPVYVAFTIANHEAATTAYPYRVRLVENGRSRIIEADTLQLTDGARQSRTVQFAVARTGQQIEVIVELPDQHQTIHFRAKS